MSWKTAREAQVAQRGVVHARAGGRPPRPARRSSARARPCRRPWPRARRRAPRRCRGRRARAARRASAERSAAPTWSATVSQQPRRRPRRTRPAASSSTLITPHSSSPTHSGHDELGAHVGRSRASARSPGSARDVVDEHGALVRRQRPIRPCSRGWLQCCSAEPHERVAAHGGGARPRRRAVAHDARTGSSRTRGAAPRRSPSRIASTSVMPASRAPSALASAELARALAQALARARRASKLTGGAGTGGAAGRGRRGG